MEVWIMILATALVISLLVNYALFLEVDLWKYKFDLWTKGYEEIIRMWKER